MQGESLVSLMGGADFGALSFGHGRNDFGRSTVLTNQAQQARPQLDHGFAVPLASLDADLGEVTAQFRVDESRKRGRVVLVYILVANGYGRVDRSQQNERMGFAQQPR